MPVYQHICRKCGNEWLEEYDLKTFDFLKAEGINLPCRECGGSRTYRAINRVPVHFKGGGWSPDGYYQFHAYDQLQAEGKKVERFEDRTDLQRVMKGERREGMLKRLKREDELAKRHFGPDAAMTQEKAEARIKKAVDKVVA